jgi:hypothetical protein
MELNEDNNLFQAPEVPPERRTYAAPGSFMKKEFVFKRT